LGNRLLFYYVRKRGDEMDKPRKGEINSVYAL
jgi:hypothetical protein